MIAASERSIFFEAYFHSQTKENVETMAERWHMLMDYSRQMLGAIVAPSSVSCNFKKYIWKLLMKNITKYSG